MMQSKYSVFIFGWLVAISAQAAGDGAHPVADTVKQQTAVVSTTDEHTTPPGGMISVTPAPTTAGETNKQAMRREDVQADIQTQKDFHELPPLPPLPGDANSTASAAEPQRQTTINDIEQQSLMTEEPNKQAVLREDVQLDKERYDHSDHRRAYDVGMTAVVVAVDLAVEGAPNKPSKKEVGQVEQSPNQQLLIQSD